MPPGTRKLGLLALRILGKSRGPGYELLSAGKRGASGFLWGGAEDISQHAKLDVLSTRL